MRFPAPALIAFSLVITAAQPGLPACGDRPGDTQAVADARAVVATRCDCAAAASHASYVDCVARAANAEARAGRLRPQCRAAVVRCAARSTCGRPRLVTCCRTRADGARRCSLRGGAAECTAPPGGSACSSSEASCCDACGVGSCAAATATTTTLPPGCGSDLDCDDGNGCTEDRCLDGKCQHQCLCVGPGGSVSCCPGPAAECPSPSWFYTCGDPVCGGHRDQGLPPCGSGETPGAPCSPEGARCDPGDSCDRLLVCASSNPVHRGGCPISRREAKDDIRYLGENDLRRLHDELMRFRLATFRYRENASHTQLGFIIDDVEPSLSVDPVRDLVDLYGYTSMAVAALQTQAREIEALRNEVEALRRQLRKRPVR
ncbi:MAG: hypothetical protein E6J75_10975 [Deltaproteobacteria bacterium]|nr:MAG: hypothetical protein E6J79_13550 [Deltaproteobacteria bacterium]TMA55851.1 MAG: hypothetical protein E6J75_10975 [Deltaproteobacteria bacterium]